MSTMKELVHKIKRINLDIINDYEIDIDPSELWNPGASLSEIEAFEKEFDMELPKDAKEFFLEINGQPKGSGDGFPFFVADGRLHSIDDVRYWMSGRIDKKTISKSDLLDTDSVPPDSVYPRLYGPGLLPMLGNELDDFVGLDLIPNVNGKYGQVLIYGYSWEDKYPIHVVFENWREYLENFIEDYENGKLREVEIVHSTWERGLQRDDKFYRYRFVNGNDLYFHDLYQEILGFERQINY